MICIIRVLPKMVGQPKVRHMIRKGYGGERRPRTIAGQHQESRDHSALSSPSWTGGTEIGTTQQLLRPPCVLQRGTARHGKARHRRAGTEREHSATPQDGAGRARVLPLFVIGADGDRVADLEQLVSGGPSGARLLDPRLTIPDLTEGRLSAQRAGVAGHPAGNGAAQPRPRPQAAGRNDPFTFITVIPAIPALSGTTCRLL